MIPDVKLQKPVGKKLENTHLVSSSMFGRLPEVIATGLDKAFAELTAKSGDAIITLLQNKIAFQKPVYDRNKSWYGKLINKMTFQECGSIEIKGIVLFAILSY